MCLIGKDFTLSVIKLNKKNCIKIITWQNHLTFKCCHEHIFICIINTNLQKSPKNIISYLILSNIVFIFPNTPHLLL